VNNQTLDELPGIPIGAERSTLTSVKVKFDMGVLLFLQAVVVRSSLDTGTRGANCLVLVQAADASGEGYLREWLRTLVCSSIGYPQMATAGGRG
jgi:hypothetical protein